MNSKNYWVMRMGEYLQGLRTQSSISTNLNQTGKGNLLPRPNIRLWVHSMISWTRFFWERLYLPLSCSIFVVTKPFAFIICCLSAIVIRLPLLQTLLYHFDLHSAIFRSSSPLPSYPLSLHSLELCLVVIKLPHLSGVQCFYNSFPFAVFTVVVHIVWHPYTPYDSIKLFLGLSNI